MAKRGADAVRAGIAAANDDDVLALGEDWFGGGRLFAADAAVLLRQEVHGEMDALEFTAGHRQVARLFRAAGQHHRVMVLDQLFGRDIDADMGAVMEGDAFRLHLCYAAIDVMLFHLEIGNAIAQQAAGLRPALIDVNLVAGACELLRAGHACRS